MRRLIVVGGMLLVAAACYHGPSIYKFAPVQGPSGIDVELRLLTTDFVQGELLEVQDSSLIVLSENRVVSVPVSAIQRGRFDQLGYLLGEGVDPESALAKLRNFSRFPAGLTPPLRARLLAAYGQTTVDVVR